jgi:hypothetical protein
LGNPAEETFCRPNQILKNYHPLCADLGENAIRTGPDFLFVDFLISAAEATLAIPINPRHANTKCFKGRFVSALMEF